MIHRQFWIDRIHRAWKSAPIVWLAGLRRLGKTTLAKALGDDAVYVNCDLPSSAARTADPERFFRDLDRSVVVFDEIHQLPEPARILKIGADEFPHIRILATGSSTVAATRSFKDTLAGRKRLVHLVPVLLDELDEFGCRSLPKRLYHGGFPQALLADDKDPEFYREWADSFFSRDIQQLFGFRESRKFNMVLEFVLRQSGGLFEVSRAARELGISRPTIEAHVRALEITHAATVVRPYHRDSQKELVKTPKLYGFDTGFVSFFRGWDPVRPSDMDVLWEHVVLEYLLAHRPHEPIHFWRTSTGHEVDFVLPRAHEQVDVIECKWDHRRADGKGLVRFRDAYPAGKNYLLCPLAHEATHTRDLGGHEVHVGAPTAFRWSCGH